MTKNRKSSNEAPNDSNSSRQSSGPSVLIKLMQQLRSEKPLPQLLYEMRILISEATAAESAAIVILDEAGIVTHYAIDESVPHAAGWIIISEATQRGLFRQVIRERRGQLIADLEELGVWFPQGLSSRHTRSLLCMPLISHRELRGLVCLMHSEAGHFDQTHQELVALMADIIAIAVENAQLRERTDRALRRRVAELSTLNALAIIAGHSLDEEQILKDALTEVCQALDVDVGFAYLLDTDKEALFRHGAWGAEEVAPQDMAMSQRLPIGLGVTGRVVLTKTPLVVSMDQYGEPRWRAMLIRNGVRTVMATPLLSRGAVQGALTLLIRQNRPATTEDLRFLSSIGNQLGVAIENARLFTKTQRRSMELNVINTVMQEITQTLALDDILERICEQTTRLMNAETFFVGLLNEEGDEIHAKVIVDKGERLEPFSFSMSDGNTLTSYIVATGESLLFYDLQAQQANLPAPGLIVGPTPRAWLGVPMMLEDRIIGAMSIQSYTPDHFTEADRRILSVVAGQTAIAISKARLFEELETRMKQLQDAQARLMQSEKMAALGALVSGVAHELNNPLTAVIGYAQLLQLRDLDDDIKRDLQRIYDGAQRSSQIANDLLTFARSYKPQRSPVDINQALQQTLALQAYEMRVHNTKIVTDLLPDLPMTMADPHRLKQVFLNLIVNAQQAMEGAKGGGILTVRTVRPPDRQGTIRIEFEDNGPGIPPEILGRIFDPFFTTKEVGKGTGLGLSICYGIITEHGGTIWAENNVERGKGTESGAIFIVEIPFVPVKDEKSGDEQSPDEAVQDEENLRILVVDDEPDVVELIRRVAEPQGHHVEKASDGIEALELLGQNDFQIIFCDLKMPGLSGDALYERVAKERPEMAQRFVFISGDTFNTESRAFVALTGRSLIMKPFSIADIQGILDEWVKRKK